MLSSVVCLRFTKYLYVSGQDRTRYNNTCTYSRPTRIMYFMQLLRGVFVFRSVRASLIILCTIVIVNIIVIEFVSSSRYCQDFLENLVLTSKRVYRKFHIHTFWFHSTHRLGIVHVKKQNTKTIRSKCKFTTYL